MFSSWISLIRLVKILFEHLNIIYVFTVYYCTVNSVKEFMQFTSQILVERTRANERASVKEQGNNQNLLLTLNCHMALVCNLPASHSWHKSLNTSINLHFTPEILTSVTLLLVTFVFSSQFLTVISTLFYHIDHILLLLSRPGGCHFFLLVKRGDVKKYCIMWEEMKKLCPFCPPPLPPLQWT